MALSIKLVESDAQLERVARVLLQLRGHFDIDSLIPQIKAQQADGYQLAFVESDGEVQCVAGFVVSTKLAWGKHIYIDDLVSDERFRSSGAGRHLIDWFKSHARDLGCAQIHLDSGVQRFAAHRFYLRHGFNIASHHFSITELGDAGPIPGR